MRAERDPIGFDPVRWVQRLRDVNGSSQFEPAAKMLIESRLNELQHELEARCYGRPEG
jgi:hypothetical protein